MNVMTIYIISAVDVVSISITMAYMFISISIGISRDDILGDDILRDDILVHVAFVMRVELVYKLVSTNTPKNFRLRKFVENSTFSGLNTSFN